MKKLIIKGIKNLILAIIMGSMIIGVIVGINLLVEATADFVNVYILTFVVFPVIVIMLPFFMD
jgi:hypothetical protein